MATVQEPAPVQRTHRDEHARWCAMCRTPAFGCVDATLTCRNCGLDFVFSAEQQRYWYEELQLWEAAKPPRLCRSCGRARRTGRVLQNRLTEAVFAARRCPDDPAVLLALAAAIAEHVAHVGRGSAWRGVTAARRVRFLDPSITEAQFWEGACHEAAGRPSRALACYERFVMQAAGVKRLRSFVDRARHRAQVLGRSSGDATGGNPAGYDDRSG